MENGSASQQPSSKLVLEDLSDGAFALLSLLVFTTREGLSSLMDRRNLVFESKTHTTMSDYFLSKLQKCASRLDLPSIKPREIPDMSVVPYSSLSAIPDVLHTKKDAVRLLNRFYEDTAASKIELLVSCVLSKSHLKTDDITSSFITENFIQGNVSMYLQRMSGYDEGQKNPEVYIYREPRIVSPKVIIYRLPDQAVKYYSSFDTIRKTMDLLLHRQKSHAYLEFHDSLIKTRETIKEFSDQLGEGDKSFFREEIIGELVKTTRDGILPGAETFIDKLNELRERANRQYKGDPDKLEKITSALDTFSIFAHLFYYNVSEFCLAFNDMKRSFDLPGRKPDEVLKELSANAQSSEMSYEDFKQYVFTNPFLSCTEVLEAIESRESDAEWDSFDPLFKKALIYSAIKGFIKEPLDLFEDHQNRLYGEEDTIWLFMVLRLVFHSVVHRDKKAKLQKLMDFHPNYKKWLEMCD